MRKVIMWDMVSADGFFEAPGHDIGWFVFDDELGGDVAGEVARLKQGSGGDIFVFGSADFAAALVANGLVDEYRIGINPVLLGSGTPLFKGGFERRSLELTRATPLKSGVVILHYVPKAG